MTLLHILSLRIADEVDIDTLGAVVESAHGDKMAYTRIQTLRKMRARNKGVNRKLAARLRNAASWLAQMGPEEFSRREIKELQNLRAMLDQRLYTNALTKAQDELLVNPKKFRLPSGRYRIELDKKDL